MKHSRSLWSMGAGLALSLLVAACGTKPGIDLLEEPVVRVTGEGIGKPTFSTNTREALRKAGIGREAKRDPDAAIRTLADRLKQGEDGLIRSGAAEMALSEAYRSHKKNPPKALGYYLAAIDLSEPGLSMPASPNQGALVAVFNEASAEVAALLHQQNSGSSSRLSVPTPFGSRALGWVGDAEGTSDARFYDTLTPRSQIRVRGFEDVNRREGVGGCMVGYRKMTKERRLEDPLMANSGYAVPVTAVLRRGSGNRVNVELVDAIVSDRVTVGGRSYPLAADYTAAVATVVNSSPGSKLGFAGMINPKRVSDEKGLYLLEPYREDRIPLVLVHGLMSTPDTWRLVVNGCYADPVIRKNYQLLVFFYPTGYPIAQNAATLRDRLQLLQRTYDPGRNNPKMREMVMVGHSMGSNLTNFQIRDGGDPLWGIFFDKPPEEVLGDPEVRRLAERGSFFSANPDIRRAVFICGPHRGSPLSNSWLGRFGARLIGYPLEAVNSASGDALRAATPVGASYLSQADSSINNLEVDSPLLLALLKQPMPHRPAIHSIIGDRGKGGGLESTDGVVPYWSSHLEGVNSEVFIPASHVEATKNREGFEELRRILYLHLGRKL